MPENDEDLEVVPFDLEFLNLSYSWLQKDKELNLLTVAPKFTKQDQYKWYKSLSKRNDYKIYGIKIFKKPAGAFGIKNIKDNSGEYWGYIALKEYWGRGFGKFLMKKAFECAKKIGIAHLYLYVRNLENRRALNLYFSVGFQVVEKTDTYIKMDKNIN